MADPCSDNPVECNEPHPAAVCAIPASDPDDDVALLALPYAQNNLGLLSFKFCHDCACLADHSLCDELRPGLPGLDDACGTSCAEPQTLEQHGGVSASLPTPAWPANGDGQGYGDGQRHDTPAAGLQDHGHRRPVVLQLRFLFRTLHDDRYDTGGGGEPSMIDREMCGR